MPTNMSSLVAALTPLLAAGPGTAQVATYDRAADFLDAVEPEIEIDFEESESPTDQHYGGGYEASGVLIFASDGYLVVRNYDAASNGFLYGADRENQSYVEIDLPPGTTAVGANVSTFYTRAAGTVKVSLSSGEEYSITVTGWSSGGFGPASSYFGAISLEAIDWIRFEAIENDDPRSFAFDAVILDNVAVSFEPLEACDARLALCEAELTACYDAPGLADADADGEADATDACPDTAAGAEVDTAGCSKEQFCAAVDASHWPGMFECWLSDWKNDEVFGARDCKVERSRGHRGRPAGACTAR